MSDGDKFALEAVGLGLFVGVPAYALLLWGLRLLDESVKGSAWWQRRWPTR